MLRWILFLALLSPAQSQAGLFKIIDRNYGTAAAYQSEIDPAFDALEASVNALLPAADNATFMGSMADNANLAGASNMANYGSPIRLFEAGVHGGLSVQAERAPTGDSVPLNTVGGIGAQATARLGMRLSHFTDGWGPLDFERAWLYFGLFTFDYSKDVTTFRFGSASLYFQYRLLEPSSIWAGALKWNGLNFGTGLRYVNLRVNISQPVSESVTESTTSMPGNPDITATYNGTVNAGAEVTALTMPLEVSVSARVAYVLTFFGGLGTDITIGKAKSIASLNGPVTITESSGTYGTMSGTAILDLGDEGSPRTVGGR
ncbi:MAG TPA: hypothetical protein VFV50_10190, partial [Bdellovibrionales bacterium]|nr:hypothetical protein [Bdellovibrionales bacterium]